MNKSLQPKKNFRGKDFKNIFKHYCNDKYGLLCKGTSGESSASINNVCFFPRNTVKENITNASITVLHLHVDHCVTLY